MQKWPSLVLVPKDAQCSETHETIIFRIFYIFSFNEIFIESFWVFFSAKNGDEKLSFAPISFKLGSAYVWKVSMKIKNIFVGQGLSVISQYILCCLSYIEMSKLVRKYEAEIFISARLEF